MAFVVQFLHSVFFVRIERKCSLMVFFCGFFKQRPGFLLWTLCCLFVLCLTVRNNLDTDIDAQIVTPATQKGLRVFPMASDKKCCVSSCGLTTEILHQFPHPVNDADRFRSWLYKVGGDILQLDNMYIYKYRKVCHLHFEAQYHTRSKRLHCGAIPTLRLPAFSVRRPLMEVMDNANQDTTRANIADQENMPLPSGSAFSVRPPLMEVMDNANQDTTRANSADQENMPLPSGSGQQQHQQDILEHLSDRTVLKARLPKKAQKEKEQSLLGQIKRLRKEKDSYQERLKKATKLATNSAFQNALNKFKTLAAIFTVMQFREISKPKMGRRFKKEEKVMALSLYKLGPRAYRWLSKIFVLPSPVTLSRLVSKANLKPGMNESIFQQLKKRVQKMKPDEKLCSLIFDEMALTPNFEYNRRKDRISGFVNHTGTSAKQIADHVLVFMVRGIMKNYKQPIFYSFCHGSTPKQVIADQIENIIKKLQEIGFIVLATVCDQGATNTSAINHLIKKTKEKYLRRNEAHKNATFEIDGAEITPLYDVPHLLKGMRNNLLTKNLKFKIDEEEKLAKWDHITDLYNKNPTYKGLKLIKNLTENHCNKEKIPKMKVKYASQLFSQTVGKTMGFLAENELLPKEAADTADFIIWMDNLFDSMNGSFKNSNIKSGKALLRNVTPSSPHKHVWQEAKRVLKTMKFISPSGVIGTVPSINNWLQTIENMEVLRDKLFMKYEIKSFWCRHFNQDPLENFFGSIRSHGIRNVSPTCAAFEVAFASLLINNLSASYSPGSNCEDDFGVVLECFDELFFSSNENAPNETFVIDFSDIESENFIINYEEKVNNPILKGQLEYVTGYLLRKGKAIIKNCKMCKNILFDEDVSKNKYLTCREYYKDKKYLTYPKENLKKCFSEVQDCIDYIVKNKSHINNLRNYIKTVLYTVIDYNFFSCEEHRKHFIEFVFDFSSRFLINTWCKSTNKLLHGSETNFDDKDLMKKEAFTYFTKRKRVKKN